MKAISQPLNLAEWNKILNKMLRYHFNISEEIKILVQTIRKEMKPELVPSAEEKANYGKIVKQAIRSMWALEYEIDDLQLDFSKSIGSIDINNLTDDFVEDVMLQSKPLQSILFQIRTRQKDLMEEIKAKYSEHIDSLEPLAVNRPQKPDPAKEKKPEEESKPAAQEAKPAEEPPKIEEPPPAAPEAQPAEVTASA